MPTDTEDDDAAIALREVADRFHVRDEKTAAWVVRKIVEERAHRERVAGWFEAETRRSEHREQFLLNRFGGELAEWVRKILKQQYGNRRSVHLPTGTVGFRTEPVKIIFTDEKTVIAWCRQHLPSAIKVVESILKTEITAYLKSTGECPDGAELGGGGDKAAVANRVANFAKLAEIENSCKMMRADLLVRLVDEDALRAIDIARVTGLRQSDLSEMYKTAKAFPAPDRPAGVTYNVLLLATRMIRKFPELRIQPAAALAEIRRMGFSQHRDVSRHFARLARAGEVRRALPAPQSTDVGIINTLHHARFQDVLSRVPNGSAKIIHCDAPYQYRSTSHGGYSSISSRSRLCDNATGEAGLSLVIDLLRHWQPKLAPGGVLLLWQASGPLHRDILEALEQFNWTLVGPIIWDKGRPQPGDLGAPYSRQTEMLWVLSRPGDDLINHDGSSRSDLLRFRPVSFPNLAGQQDHCFEKPREICEFLIRKHSHRGELVLDLCGCTGSMTLAAIESQRQWVYVESNPENYQLGAGRIGRRLAERQSKVS